MSSIATFTSAASLLTSIGHVLESSPRASNIMYPHALKAASENLDQNNFWIVCYQRDNCNGPVDFVLSCTTGSMGTLPIFIFSPHPTSQLVGPFLKSRMTLIAEELLKSVPKERVFSVFALDQVARMFASIWHDLTGIQALPNPYYAATFTFCTEKSITKARSNTIMPGVGYELRLATEKDAEAAADLCFGFAAESVRLIAIGYSINF
jgi:hypothetical protein